MDIQKKVRTSFESHKVEWVPVAKVTVDDRAQRKYLDSWAQQLADRLDPDLLGYPLVWANSNGDGDHYTVLDGQHRIAAVRLALGDNQTIECEVVRGISRARAAQLYRERNHIRLPRVVDLFLAGITAQNPECTEIDAIVRKAGFQVKNGPGSNHINAVSSLQRLYRISAQLLADTLAMVDGAWGKAQAAVNGDVLLGVGMVLKRYGLDLDRDALLRRLAQHPGGADGILGRGRALRQAYGGNIGNGVARAVVLAYNSGRSKKRLPEWGTANEHAAD